MNDKRTLIGAIIAFVVGLLFGQQEKPKQTMRWRRMHDAGIFHADDPQELEITCKPSSVQYDFPLEAVGLDRDGKIKRLNELNRDSI